MPPAHDQDNLTVAAGGALEQPVQRPQLAGPAHDWLFHRSPLRWRPHPSLPKPRGHVDHPGRLIDG